MARNAYRGSREPEPQPYGYDTQGAANGYAYDAGYDTNYAEEDYRRPAYEQQRAAAPAGPQRPRVTIYQVTQFQDSCDVIDDLLDGHSVLINLERIGLEDQQRVIDALIGACYALNGTIKKVAQQTYLIAPQSVEVGGTYAEDPQTDAVFQ